MNPQTLHLYKYDLRSKDMNNKKLNIKNNALYNFYVLWSTQSLSQLGSAVTGFALTLWLYDKTGSALSTAALSICSYAPYVLMSILAGAITDRLDKKKTMLVCDTIAALFTVAVFVLYKTDSLEVWHLYLINAFTGLMNTVQQPSSEVVMTMIVPKEHYQKMSGCQSLSRSTISILNPVIAAALYGLAGLDLVIAVDLISFAVAFISLAFFVKIPEIPANKSDNILSMAKEGIGYLKKTPLVFTLILFMSSVNLVASAFDATLPGFVLPNKRGGDTVLGYVSAMAGIAMIIGSLIVQKLPKPKNRVRVVYITMLLSLGTENFLLAFSRSPLVWCIGQFIGWIWVPIMSANLDIILRNTIPLELQGRVYACRNSFQFFTIPIGLFLGGILVDNVCEPFMAKHAGERFLEVLFGSGKGSGAALVMFILGVTGALLCLICGSRLKKYKYDEN